MKMNELNSNQIYRLYQRVLQRIDSWGEGRAVDWRTLNHCRPGLARTYNDVKSELMRRQENAVQN